MTIKQMVSLCAPGLILSQVSAAEKPNILFVYADDISFETLYSQERLDGMDIETPNLDRLMAGGARFTQAHNQGGWSPGLSVASRTMMETGQYLWKAAQTSKKSILKTGMPNNPRTTPEYTVERKPFQKLWSAMMREAGYNTYMAGKWHVDGITPAKLYDQIGVIRGGMPRQHADCYGRLFSDETPDKWTPYDVTYGGYWQGGKHWIEVTRNNASQYIRTTKGSDKPFFMYIAFNAAHDPRQSPKEYIDKYPLDKIAVPENFLPEYPYADEIGCGDYLRDEQLAPVPRNEMSVKKNKQEYYALITYMDFQIGKILGELEAAGKADNTYIIFTADQGISIGDHGFMGKQNMYENSIRVPLIVYGPGIPEGKSVEEFVYLQDIMPTTLELAGYEKPSHVDFNSLLPLAKGATKKSQYEYIYGAYIGVQRMVKSKDYKMLIYPNINLVRLYDLKKDPLEMNDLAKNPKYKKTMISLFSELKKLQKEVNDPLDVTQYFNAHMKTLK